MNIRKPWVELSQAEQDTVLGTNMLAPAALLRDLYLFLQKSHAPAVVNVRSGAAHDDVGRGAAYAMGKAALVQLTAAWP